MMVPPPPSPPPPPPPPLPSTAPLVVNLVMRLISLVTIVLAIGILGSNSVTIDTGFDYVLKFSFKDVIAYRYMLSTAVIGLPYTILQIGLALNRGSVGGLTSDSVALFNFYGDTIVSYLLITGSAAGFGATNDLKHLIELSTMTPEYSGFGTTKMNADVDKFLDKGFASASLLLIGSLCAAFLSISSSSFNSPRKTIQYN